jgi:hypothetical protein
MVEVVGFAPATIDLAVPPRRASIAQGRLLPRKKGKNVT